MNILNWSKNQQPKCILSHLSLSACRIFDVPFRKLWHIVSMAQDTVMLAMCFKFPCRILFCLKTCFSCHSLYIPSANVSGEGVWWSNIANWVSLAHWESVGFSLARHKAWSVEGTYSPMFSWCVCWPALWPQTWPLNITQTSHSTVGTQRWRRAPAPLTARAAWPASLPRWASPYSWTSPGRAGTWSANTVTISTMLWWAPTLNWLQSRLL